MNLYEVEARFAHAKEAGRKTGCTIKGAKTLPQVRLRELERVIVFDGIPIDMDSSYEVKQRIFNGTTYRKVVKKAKD